MENVRIVFYSDEKNEDLVLSLIHSIESIKLNDKVRLTYYTINYKTEISIKNLDSVVINIERKYNDVRDYQLIKPSILLKSINDYPETEYFLYVDTDIVFSHRFNLNKIINHDELNISPIPLCPWHPVNKDDNSKFMINNHYRVFGSGYKLTSLIQNCFIVFSKRHKWFMGEWDALCKSDWYLNKLDIDTNFQTFKAADESVFWGLMIKYKCDFNLGHIHVNHSNYEWINFSEKNEKSWYQSSDIPQNGHTNNSKIMFYHMMKNSNENIKIINEIISKK